MAADCGPALFQTLVNHLNTTHVQPHYVVAVLIVIVVLFVVIVVVAIVVVLAIALDMRPLSSLI